MANRRYATHAFRLSIGLLFTLSSFLAFHGPSQADTTEGEAVEVVRGLVENIWSSRGTRSQSKETTRELARAIEASTSVKLLGRLVLGKHWRSLDAADQEEYQSLFSKVIVGGLATRLNTILNELNGPLEQHFTIVSSAAAGKKDVLVRSKVFAFDGPPLSVDWRLRKLESGPVIIDLIVEGVSLLVSQRAEFASVIERSKVEGLLNSLRQRLRDSNY